MTKQYRILERSKYEAENVFIAQRTRKFLWLFPYWCTYQSWNYAGTHDREFETYEEAKAYIEKDVKWDNWNGKRKDRVIALFQVDADGNLMEISKCK